MPRLLNLLLALLAYLCVATTALAAAPNTQQSVSSTLKTITIDQSPKYELSANNALYWVENKPAVAASLFAAGMELWQPINKALISVGWQNKPVWFRFEVQNNSNEAVNRLMEIRWINFDQIDFYQQRQTKGALVHYAGGLKLANNSHYRDSTSYLFPIQLAPHERSQILLSVSSRVNSVFLPTFIWQEQAFIDDQRDTINWYCLAFGILIALMLYNASLYIFTREDSYFSYSLYALSILIYQLGMTGIGNYYIWGDWEWLRRNGMMLGVHLSFISASFFTIQFLDLKHYSRFFFNLTCAGIGYWSLSLALLLLGIDHFLQLSLLASLLTCIAAIIITTYLWTLGNVSAKYFTIAWTALIVFTIATVLMMAGLLPYSSMTEFGQTIGFVAEMLLLSLALAERINRERLQRAQAQQQALALQLEINSEREAKILAQEQMMAAQKRTNQELEAHVSARTQELKRAMMELETVNRELAYLSVMDGLTKVSNRRHFDEVLARELYRAERSRHSIALILVDIDHFKRFNDSYGHLVGDDCLRAVATTLRDFPLRNSDLVARYGGEEFAIILPDTTEADAYIISEKIRLQIAHIEFIHNGKRIPVTASLGVAGMVPTPSFTPNQLIEAADSALYRAKDQGRNCSVAAMQMFDGVVRLG